MATYLELWNLQNDENFQKRVKFALLTAASNIMGEAEDGPRKVWAKKVFSWSLQTSIQLITLRVLGNPSIALSGAAATDQDIQFTINQMASDLIALG